MNMSMRSTLVSSRLYECLEWQMESGATFDLTATYRYRLWREWDAALPKVGFVMLNPSRADATENDPTIRRCIGFAKGWGYGGLEVGNLFAYRATHPKKLCEVADPVGSENDEYLKKLVNHVDRVILAWGNHGSLQGRDRAVLGLFQDAPIYCLGITKFQHPTHPLYLKSTVLPVQYQP